MGEHYAKIIRRKCFSRIIIINERANEEEAEEDDGGGDENSPQYQHAHPSTFHHFIKTILWPLILFGLG